MNCLDKPLLFAAPSHLKAGLRFPVIWIFSISCRDANILAISYRRLTLAARTAPGEGGGSRHSQNHATHALLHLRCSTFVILQQQTYFSASMLPCIPLGAAWLLLPVTQCASRHTPSLSVYQARMNTTDSHSMCLQSTSGTCLGCQKQLNELLAQ